MTAESLGLAPMDAETLKMQKTWNRVRYYWVLNGGRSFD
jgi:hypothetical protein